MHDNPQDLANTLDFIYPIHVPHDSALPLPHTTLMGLLRVASKYRIADLQKWGLKELKSVLPLQADYLSSTGNTDRVYKYVSIKDAMDVILFARELKLPCFLPLAFYALATNEADGETVESSAVLQKLSLVDQLRLKKGYQVMIRWIMVEGRKLAENGFGEARCAYCKWGRADVFDPQKAEDRWNELVLHPLEEVERRLAYDTTNWLCANPCAAEFVQNTRHFRQTFAKALPFFFALE